MALRKGWIGLFVLLVIALFILVWVLRTRPSATRCDYDGVKIEPIYAVYFILKDGTEKKFCSIACASLSFPELKSRIKEVVVVNERSGTKINASQALFVESEVVTVPHVKNRIHVFANKEDALKHIQKFKGNWVENPFR